MSTYSSRQLRENPAPLLREVEDGGLAVVTVRGKPVAVVVPFEEALKAGARAGLAARLLASRAVSLGTAAQIAERSVEGMIGLMGELGYENVFSDVGRFEEDLHALDSL
jgi:prevent-host-death family protein